MKEWFTIFKSFDNLTIKESVFIRLQDDSFDPALYIHFTNGKYIKLELSNRFSDKEFLEWYEEELNKHLSKESETNE